MPSYPTFISNGYKIHTEPKDGNYFMFLTYFQEKHNEKIGAPYTKDILLNIARKENLTTGFPTYGDKKAYENFLVKELEKKYSPNYRRVLKHRILGKRKTLTNDLLLINEVLDKLQSL